jgi:hypothetical protein
LQRLFSLAQGVVDVIDYEREKMVTLSQAAKLMPGRPDVSTLWRWRTRGLNGVRLATIKCGHKRLTSLEAIRAFIAASTAAADGESRKEVAKPESPSSRKRRLERVDVELDRLGI